MLWKDIAVAAWMSSALLGRLPLKLMRSACGLYDGRQVGQPCTGCQLEARDLHCEHAGGRHSCVVQ